MGIDDYLDALCTALTVNPLRRDEIRLEVHTHLREQADQYTRQGMSREAAENRAMEEFGDPIEVAARLSSSGAVFRIPALAATKRRIGWTMIVLGGAILAHLLLFHQAVYGANLSPEDTQTQITTVRALMAFTTFYFLLGAGYLMNRRWVLFPTVLVLLPNLLPFLYLCLRAAQLDLRMYPVVFSFFSILGIGSLYVLWMLLNPRSLQVRWLEER